jgi:Ca2+-binding EF-hand superfamily protein
MKSDSDMIKPPINEAKQKIMSNMNIVQKQFKMQKTAMKWIIRELSDEKEFKKISNIFLNLDKDKSGYLSRSELIIG